MVKILLGYPKKTRSFYATSFGSCMCSIEQLCLACRMNFICNGA